jgi:hypothetical protein
MYFSSTLTLSTGSRQGFKGILYFWGRVDELGCCCFDHNYIYR